MMHGTNQARIRKARIARRILEDFGFRVSEFQSLGYKLGNLVPKLPGMPKVLSIK